eukprot:5332982-Alexandrium_andersonii.AAC.1
MTAGLTQEVADQRGCLLRIRCWRCRGKRARATVRNDRGSHSRCGWQKGLLAAHMLLAVSGQASASNSEELLRVSRWLRRSWRARATFSNDPGPQLPPCVATDASERQYGLGPRLLSMRVRVVR